MPVGKVPTPTHSSPLMLTLTEPLGSSGRSVPSVSVVVHERESPGRAHTIFSSSGGRSTWLWPGTRTSTAPENTRSPEVTAMPMKTIISTTPSTMSPVPNRYQNRRETRRGGSSAGGAVGVGGSPYGQPGGGWAFGWPGNTSGGTSCAMAGKLASIEPPPGGSGRMTR